jgi:hypothetical protein
MEVNNFCEFYVFEASVGKNDMPLRHKNTKNHKILQVIEMELLYCWY